MKIKSATFEHSAPSLEDCPASSLPEFPFIGRSNVGKSSIVNLLTGRDGLARVSATPGKTTLINFFKVNETWTLVDLPGYGYAAVSKHERSSFNAAVQEYLRARLNILYVFLLIDSRLPPQPIDLEFIQWLGENGVPFVLLFTKADKLSAKQLNESIDRFKATLAETWEELPRIFISSAKDGSGRGEILRFISESAAAWKLPASVGEKR